MDRLLRHEVAAGGTPSRTVHFRATGGWLAICRPEGRIGCSMRCSWSTYSASAWNRFTSHSGTRTSALPGFALAWRQVSAGEQQFESHVRIAVHSSVSAGHAPCLILVRLGISGSPLPYLSAWNNEPIASLLLGSQRCHRVWSRGRRACTTALNTFASGAARTNRRLATPHLVIDSSTSTHGAPWLEPTR